MPNLKPIFPKFVYTETLNLSDNYNNEIKSEIIKLLKNKDPSASPYSITDFKTKDSEEIIKNPTFAPPFAMIRENIDMCCRGLNFQNKFKIVNAWINITPPGKYHDVHKHIGSAISGVYYVQADPPMQLNFIYDGVLDIENQSEDLHAKKLILFDSTLSHGFTHVNINEEPKITIAFNCVPL